MTLRILLVCLACGTAAGLICQSASADDHATISLPNSADAPCLVEGSTLHIDLTAAPAAPLLTFPRLNNVVLEVSWAPRGDDLPAGTTTLGEHRYLEPPLTDPARRLSLTQTPEIWSVHLTDAIAYPARISIRCSSPPLHAPEGHTCTAAADGTLTLPARHALVRGEKLQFEPLTHKNTVGYWVNPDDAAAWLLATDAAQNWDVHVLQGCGGGQGGSRVQFAAGDHALVYTVVETGHFQNFRWQHVGTLDLPAGEHRLEVSCVEKARNAVMDIRQIRLVPKSGTPQPPLVLHDSDPDVLLPPLSHLPPAAGRRVVLRLPGQDSLPCYHTLSLPTDWQPNRRYPVLAEWAGNGPYRGGHGDVNSGRVEDACLAQGLAGTDGAIVLGLPYLSGDGTHNVTQWWGTPPNYDHEPTIAYAKAAIDDICDRFGGDPHRVALVGFSRGAIACNALGLADDAIASRWTAAICFSHYDGLRAWPFSQSSPEAARARLTRLGGRQQLIIAESGDVSPPPALDATREYLKSGHPGGAFTFLESGFVNHDDDWALRPCPARHEARRWLSTILEMPARDESL